MVFFTEPDPKLFANLKTTVDALYRSHPGIHEPILLNSTFAEGTDQLFDYLTQERIRLAPTFLFVDPCGVNGASLTSIGKYAAEHAELFLFFNYDGINRIAGLRDGARDTLVELLGSTSDRDALISRLESCATPQDRESCILGFYLDLLRDRQGWTYTCPFRVEKEGRRATSHYLIHATKHPMGFRVMKEVMWPLGHTEERPGGLMFAQASRDPLPRLFPSEDDEPRNQILSSLTTSKRLANYFYRELSEQAGNYLCERDYRPALLALESERKIEVWDPKTGSAAPAVTRRKGKSGQRTLAGRLIVQLVASA